MHKPLATLRVLFVFGPAHDCRHRSRTLQAPPLLPAHERNVGAPREQPAAADLPLSGQHNTYSSSARPPAYSPAGSLLALRLRQGPALTLERVARNDVVFVCQFVQLLQPRGGAVQHHPGVAGLQGGDNSTGTKRRRHGEVGADVAVVPAAAHKAARSLTHKVGSMKLLEMRSW
jgi:hypothetical protein